MSDQLNHAHSPPVIALAGWVLPGGGYWLLGERLRAIVVGATILVLFVMGILISGIRVVEAPPLRGPGNIVSRVLQKPWFIGQVLTGPVGVATAWASNALADNPKYKRIQSKARLAEIGTLYTAVAGMLNLLATIDAAYRGSAEKR